VLLLLVGCSTREPTPVKAEAIPPLASLPSSTTTPASAPSASATASAPPSTCENACKTLSDACDQGCPAGEAGRGCLKKCGCKWIGCQKACAAKGEVDFTCH